MFPIAHWALPNTSFVDGQLSLCFSTSAHAAKRARPAGWGQGFRELQEGQKVQFDITQGQRGPQAENIIPA
jgi:hypothetical protein